MTGRPARLSRVNAVDNCNATSQPTAARAVCGQHAINDFHTSVVRGARGAGSRRVASGKVFHASARDHADTAACRPSEVHDTAACRPSGSDHDSVTYGNDRVSQSTMPTVTISDQSVQTDRLNSQAESNSTVSDCVHDVYCNKINAAVDSNEFESVNGDLSVEMNRKEVNFVPC